MKIVQVNIFDIAGGAARAAYRLHTGMIAHGHNSSMFVAKKNSNDTSVVQFKVPAGFINRKYREFRQRMVEKDFAPHSVTRPNGFELFTNDRNMYGRQSVSQIPKADVVNLHWISLFIDYRAFFKTVPRRSKVVWTLHDLNPLTGGCHYDMGCGRYMTGCGNCPQLGSNSSGDLSSRIWQRKNKLFNSLDSSQLNIVVVSKWMEKQVLASPILGKFPVSIVPNGLDVGVFKPKDGNSIRREHGIQSYEKVVLFMSDSTTNIRKGFSSLAKAMTGGGDINNMVLVSVGRNKPVVETPIKHIYLGPIDDDKILSAIYSAADIFVIPSIQDNLPNTVMESIACGTPVVGNNVGGIPDMVRPGVTGLLVEAGNINALGTNIRNLLKDDDLLKNMSRNCREIAVKEYSVDVQVKRYLELYGGTG